MNGFLLQSGSEVFLLSHGGAPADARPSEPHGGRVAPTLQSMGPTRPRIAVYPWGHPRLLWGHRTARISDSEVAS